MIVYTYKDSDGILRPRAFIAYEDDIQYQEKEIKRLLKDGGEIVKIEIKELK